MDIGTVQLLTAQLACQNDICIEQVESISAIYGAAPEKDVKNKNGTCRKGAAPEKDVKNKNGTCRKVPPRVKVSHHQTDRVTKLHCQVYGFYPRDVDVKWVKNGIEDVYSEEAKQILPNPDGTYQIRVTVEVTPQEGDSYSCHVDHSSLKEIMIILWDPSKDNTVYIIFGVIALIVIIAGAGIGYAVYKK
ncbi:hereditary hemochromatosis protein-like [Discoglossus pictus]